MAKGRATKRPKSWVQVQREFERTFLEDGIREKIGKAMVDLKFQMMENKELSRKLQGAPIRVWTRLMIAALDLDPRSEPTVREILESRYVKVDEEGRAWANSTSWYKRTEF